MRVVTICLAFLATVFFSPSGNAALGEKKDSKLPIEITADGFELFQQENKAIFTGHVIAIQGKMNLKSDVMTVFYKSGQQKNGITKINVNGNVLLASPEENGQWR